MDSLSHICKDGRQYQSPRSHTQSASFLGDAHKRARIQFDTFCPHCNCIQVSVITIPIVIVMVAPALVFLALINFNFLIFIGSPSGESINQDGNFVCGQSESLKHLTLPSGSSGPGKMVWCSGLTGNSLICGEQQYLWNPGSPQTISGSSVPTSSEGQNLALMHSLPGGHLSRFGEEEEQRNGGRIMRRWSLRSHILLVQYRLFDWEPVAGRARKNGRWAPGAERCEQEWRS